METQVTTAEAINILLIYCEKLGWPVDRIMEDAGVEPGSMESLQRPVTLGELSRFFASAVKVSGDPYIGLHIGDISNLDALGIVGQLYRYSKNMREGMFRVIMTPRHHAPEAAFVTRQFIELAMAYCKHGTEYASQAGLNPYEVHFAWALTAEEEKQYAEIFACPVYGNRANTQLMYRPAGADFPNFFYNPVLLKALEAGADAGMELAPWSSNDLQKALLIMNVEEKERSRIARSLHDGVCGTLAAVRMHLGVLQDQVPSLHTAEFLQTLALLDEAAREVRKTAHSLMPEVLQQYGLNSALETHCHNLAPCCPTQINFYSFGTPFRFEPGAELTVYRTAQELIQNAVKHAQADSIIVQLQFDGEDISLTIEDDGIGLPPDRLRPGSGLDILRQNVTGLGGTIDWDGRQGSGTSVTVTIPSLHAILARE
ncbi:AraC family transcriptional regulator ligand-binding domain-containing protein [Chitinophaga sp.]|uniref:AraC family transcriptional regulator ligand-binding domain-containing protein n=1 Tax=Chitinophaga sp. TaxID=1869181 RepID=UPI00261D4D4D|nr:AraC family transcriptional regulator ligand-binding domain-containing protein [uncultured Chitinophaga sp.]